MYSTKFKEKKLIIIQPENMCENINILGKNKMVKKLSIFFGENKFVQFLYMHNCVFNSVMFMRD